MVPLLSAPVVPPLSSPVLPLLSSPVVPLLPSPVVVQDSFLREATLSLSIDVIDARAARPGKIAWGTRPSEETSWSTRVARRIAPVWGKDKSIDRATEGSSLKDKSRRVQDSPCPASCACTRASSLDTQGAVQRLPCVCSADAPDTALSASPGRRTLAQHEHQHRAEGPAGGSSPGALALDSTVERSLTQHQEQQHHHHHEQQQQGEKGPVGGPGVSTLAKRLARSRQKTWSLPVFERLFTGPGSGTPIRHRTHRGPRGLALVWQKRRIGLTAVSSRRALLDSAEIQGPPRHTLGPSLNPQHGGGVQGLEIGGEGVPVSDDKGVVQGFGMGREGDPLPDYKGVVQGFGMGREGDTVSDYKGPCCIVTWGRFNATDRSGEGPQP